MTEWELLCVAEDIEQGDSIEVELEDGSSEPMVFCKTFKGSVILRNANKDLRRYSQATLECLEEDDGSYILGKSPE